MSQEKPFFYERGTTAGLVSKAWDHSTVYVQWFRGGLVFEAYMRFYHSALGARTKNKRREVHARAVRALNFDRPLSEALPRELHELVQ